MHIRVQTYRDKSGNTRQGKSVSLLCYAYDRAKKRSGQVVLGTVDYWAKTLPTELESILTDAEREEFREWIAERDRQLAEYKQKSHLLHAAEHMGWAAKALAARSEASPTRADLGCPRCAGEGAGEGRTPETKPSTRASIEERNADAGGSGRQPLR
ncbi:hypothetical protein [Nitrosomonas sp.]|uniref:hypothetical protein n=1 Tax=Nitrosomonas sp. TaxID=42353 RepID=UPI002604DE31|nr:hypothetical protein [Nitrosomonas sp.]